MNAARLRVFCFLATPIVMVALLVFVFGPLGLAAQEREVPGATAASASRTHVRLEQAPAPNETAEAASVSGSGTVNYVPLWTSSTALGNSKLYQTGGKIGIGTTSPSVNLDVNGRINSSVAYNLKGTTVLATPNNGLSTGNLALGYNAMESITTAQVNTAVGYYALWQDTTGGGNTAVGWYTLLENTVGTNNTAMGDNALRNNNGIFNTASGYSTMFDNSTGGYNEASGDYALYSNTTGSENTAEGSAALINNVSGSNNIAIGVNAGEDVPTDASYNILIGSEGSPTDYSTIRIGDAITQTAFFAGGIRGVTTGRNDAIPVMIDSNGQLGTINSSRRFKEDIHDMGEASRGLMQLRPVTFRYQKPFSDGSKPIQYGLIAEEVEEVYPDLVAHSADGDIESVKYQLLDTMLLNEVQRQNKEIERQKALIENQSSQLLSQQNQIQELISQIRDIRFALNGGHKN